MLKKLIALSALTLATACVAPGENVAVTRDFTGSLTGCPGVTGVSAIYSQSAAGLPVRCGPQTVSPVTYR